MNNRILFRLGVPWHGFHKDDILRKLVLVPRWPDRRSYASHKRKKVGAR